MAKPAKKVSKWKYRYRFTIFNDYTFEEVWQVRFSKLNIFILLGSLIVLLIALTTVLIAFTNLREFIPGYPDGNMRRNIVLNAYRLDSLENELRMRDQYFENISIRKTVQKNQDEWVPYILKTNESSKEYWGIGFARSSSK